MEARSGAGIARDAVRGGGLLGLRQVFAQALNLAGYALLARLLGPTEIGVLGIVLFVCGFLGTCGGAGLQASLIRLPDEPTPEEYRAVFTLQEAIMGVIALVAVVAAPWLAALYGRPPEEAWLFRMVGVALVVTSFQAIPAAMLERRLDFGKVAFVEVAQALAYNVVVVGLVWAGWGTASFGAALLARAATGALLATLASPWSARPLWDWERARGFLRIGAPLQGTVLVGQLKDSITPIFIGLAAGAATVGYVQWAQTLATGPLWASMVLSRVYLPTFARVQREPARLARFVDGAVRAAHALVAPGAVLLLALAEPVTRLVFGPQWLPALPILRILWLVNLVVPTTTAVLALLAALGDTRTSLRFALLWLATTWLFGVPAVLLAGGLGYALANAAVLATNLWLFRVARERAALHLASATMPVWLWAAAVGVAVHVTARLRPCEGLADLATYLLAGGLLYAAGLAALAPSELRQMWRWARGRA
ncbi:MAG: oligosaccharide flippase family protein [Deltaproteobacteria bacterium]|nr:oligosaccharide flippase family protein [Deltaproteobacteria bacterium]